MRIIIVFILLAFGCQQTTVNGQQTLCTLPELVEGTTSDGASLHLCDSASKEMTQSQTHGGASLREADYASFHEYQICKADSLYKNYLPQYNFDEVKAAMEFFDSIRSSGVQEFRSSGFKVRGWGKKDSKNHEILKSSNPEFLNARAHYYHAVGLTEKDDVVGACEHYLIALEIMEPLVETHRRASNNRRAISVDNPEDYEKIRFVSLIHTRLGEVFLNESYCNLAIANYRKVLRYCESFNDKYSISQTLKYLGYSYQLSNNADSALYYYNESLKTSRDIGNKLDVEKCIAQIMYFDKGERDSAFMILRNNLNRITNEEVKYSYHFTIGNMFNVDKAYDSALFYLEESLDNNIITKKIAFTTTLSAIYDSISNYEKKAYYDNFSANLLKSNINKEVDKSKLQVLYNNYNERKAEKGNAIARTKIRKTTITISLVVLVIVISVITYIRYNHRKLHDELKKEIDNRTKDIESKNSIISQKEKLINEYQITNENKDKIIYRQKKEIDRIKTRINKKGRSDIEAYYTSNVCKKILSRKDNDFSCLKEDELALLLEAADKHLDNISYRLQNSFPELNKKDIYTICLIILNLEKKLPVLLGRNTKTIWDRLHKLKKLMNVESNSDLFLYIKDNFID